MANYVCPVCGFEEGFEKRGTRRTYHPLDESLQLDGWDHGDVVLDRFDDSDEEIIFCLACDNELHEETIVKANIGQMSKELRDEIRAALEGDSNDAEHDALASVASEFGIEYRDPDDVLYDDN